MRFHTEPTWRQADYDNLEHVGDRAPGVLVTYTGPQPEPMRLHGSRDYRFRRDGDGWVLESRSGGYRERPWDHEGRLTGEPPPVDGAVPGVTEYLVTARGSARPGEWEIRPGFVAKPSGTCDP